MASTSVSKAVARARGGGQGRGCLSYRHDLSLDDASDVLARRSWAVGSAVKQSTWPRPALTTFRVLALLAAAGISAFALMAHPAFLDVPLVGLIVMATVLAALRIGLGDQRLIRGAKQFLAFLSDLDRPTGNRVPLQELLGPKAGSSRGGEVS